MYTLNRSLFILYIFFFWCEGLPFYIIHKVTHWYDAFFFWRPPFLYYTQSHTLMWECSKIRFSSSEFRYLISLLLSTTPIHHHLAVQVQTNIYSYCSTIIQQYMYKIIKNNNSTIIQQYIFTPQKKKKYNSTYTRL